MEKSEKIKLEAQRLKTKALQDDESGKMLVDLVKLQGTEEFLIKSLEDVRKKIKDLKLSLEIRASL